MHAYALPVAIPGCTAQALHVGEVAKARAIREARREGSDLKTAGAKGRRAYLVAMSNFQDQYFLEVGEPYGLLRDGPKRRREPSYIYRARKEDARLRSASRLQADREALDVAQAATLQKMSEAEDQIGKARPAEQRWKERQDLSRQEIREELRDEVQAEFDRLKVLENGIATQIQAGITQGIQAAIKHTSKVLSGLFDGSTRKSASTGQWELPEESVETIRPFWKWDVGPLVNRLWNAEFEMDLALRFGTKPAVGEYVNATLAKILAAPEAEPEEPRYGERMACVMPCGTAARVSPLEQQAFDTLISVSFVPRFRLIWSPGRHVAAAISAQS